MFSKKKFVLALIILIYAISLPLSIYAQELTYDRYASSAEQPSQPSLGKRIALHFLVYPFELIRWPMDKGLILTEKYALDKKVKWIYDKALDHGITPSEYIISAFNWGSGLSLDFLRLLGQKQRFPNQTLKVWGIEIADVQHEVGAQIGWERIAESGFHAFGLFKYENKPRNIFTESGRIPARETVRLTAWK